MRGGGPGGSSSRYAPMPTGSSSRYALHPCTLRHPPAHAAIASFCIPASRISHFLGRVVWGCAALGDSGAPPHAPCAFPLSLQPGRWHGLHRWQPVCSRIPVHHWAGCGLAIRCPAIRLQQVGQVADSEACSVSPAPITSRTTVTKCDDPAPTAPTCHGWKRSYDMLMAVASMQPYHPTDPCSRWQVTAPAPRSPSPDRSS
jgi:hypothetical protein